MQSFVISVLFVALLTVSSARATCSNSAFDPKAADGSVPPINLGPPHVHFVDLVKTQKGYFNFLFRGGNPDISKGQSMNFDGLLTQIRAAAKDAKVDLPKAFYLVDVNLLNMDPFASPGLGFDLHNLLGEYGYFKKNPSHGTFIFWEVMGTNDNATIMSEASEDTLSFFVKNLGTWQGDNLIGRMESLRQLLTTDWGMPAVLYGHCDCGCDRTGEIFGSYNLRWMNKTWEETNKINTNIATRPMSCNNYLAMQWYCFWLRDVQNFSHLKCQHNFDCSNPELPPPSNIY